MDGEAGTILGTVVILALGYAVDRLKQSKGKRAEEAKKKRASDERALLFALRLDNIDKNQTRFEEKLDGLPCDKHVEEMSAVAKDVAYLMGVKNGEKED